VITALCKMQRDGRFTAANIKDFAVKLACLDQRG
jgi:hypothetical protein